MNNVNPAHKDFINTKIADAVDRCDLKEIYALHEKGGSLGVAVKLAVKKWITEKSGDTMNIICELTRGRSWHNIPAMDGSLESGDFESSFLFIPEQGTPRVEHMIMIGEYAARIGRMDWVKRVREYLIRYLDMSPNLKLRKTSIRIFDKRVNDRRMDIKPIAGTRHARYQFSYYISIGKLDEANELELNMSPTIDITKTTPDQKLAAVMDAADPLDEITPDLRLINIIYGLARAGLHYMIPPIMRRVPYNMTTQAHADMFLGSLAGGYLNMAKEVLSVKKRGKVKKEIRVEPRTALEHAARSGFIEVVDYIINKYDMSHGQVIYTLLDEEAWDLAWFYINKFKYRPNLRESGIFAQLLCKYKNEDLLKQARVLMDINIDDSGVIDPFFQDDDDDD